jgi:hypothetical protein
MFDMIASLWVRAMITLTKPLTGAEWSRARAVCPWWVTLYRNGDWTPREVAYLVRHEPIWSRPTF